MTHSKPGQCGVTHYLITDDPPKCRIRLRQALDFLSTADLQRNRIQPQSQQHFTLRQSRPWVPSTDLASCKNADKFNVSTTRHSTLAGWSSANRSSGISNTITPWRRPG